MYGLKKKIQSFGHLTAVIALKTNFKILTNYKNKQIGDQNFMFFWTFMKLSFSLFWVLYIQSLGVAVVRNKTQNYYFY